MESLNIPATDITPGIRFNASTGVLEIEGNSLPEDVIGFYKDIFQWVQNYIEHPNSTTTINIRLNYFNSSSSKVLLDILSILEGLTDQNVKVEVNWFYLELDDDMLQTGKEFESLVKIPFKFVNYMDNK